MGLALLLDGLERLEVVRFDHSTGSGDEAFFGDFGGQPAFLKLKRFFG